MKKIVILSLMILLSFSCSSTKTLSNNKDYVVFTLRKTGCKGKCPVYYMEIFKSGKIIYEGTKNVDKIGKFGKQITGRAVKKIIIQFEKSNFDNLLNEYSANVTDLPTTYISFTHNNKTKTIRDYSQAPRELKDLELILENIANSKDWAKIDF